MEMQETILLLRQQVKSLSDKTPRSPQIMAGNEGIPFQTCSEELSKKRNKGRNGIGSFEESYVDDQTPTSVMGLNRIFSQDDKNCNNDTFLNSQVLMQVIVLSISFVISSI